MDSMTTTHFEKLLIGMQVHYLYPNGTHSEASVLPTHNRETGGHFSAGCCAKTHAEPAGWQLNKAKVLPSRNLIVDCNNSSMFQSLGVFKIENIMSF